MSDGASTNRIESGGELRAARRTLRAVAAPLVLFSLVVNLLMLTGPLFLLQLYERVIASRSEETLVALLVLAAFLYLIMVILDQCRGRIAVRAGARLQALLERPVFDAALRRPAPETAPAPWSDLDAIRRFAASPSALSILDMPWTPMLLGVIFLFHPTLGLFGVAAAALLATLTLYYQARCRPHVQAAMPHAQSAGRLGDEASAKADELRALGMSDAFAGRWVRARRPALAHTVASNEYATVNFTGARTLRLFLQSSILAVGAWLVVQEAMSAGAMIAASILLGRALAPIDSAILQWSTFRQCRSGWDRITALLDEAAPPQRRTRIAPPAGRLEGREMTVIPPGARRPALRMVSLRLEPGAALGVIGAAGSGKTALAYALTGAWPLASGSVRLDGAQRAHHDPEGLAAAIGYMPQSSTLFAGTISENIARLQPEAEDAAITRAAMRAGAHDMILQLPEGYETRLSPSGAGLSAGQRQRIALARALFGDPAILILDDPTSALDGEGYAGFDEMLRTHLSEGGAALVLSHRPAAISACEQLLLLDDGVRKAIGPRDCILRELGQDPARQPPTAMVGQAS